MRSRSSGLAVFALICACGADRLSTEEQRDFLRLEAALSTIDASLIEDRQARLDELDALRFSSKTIDELRRTCITAHRKYVEAAVLLVQARADTRKMEQQIAAVKNGSRETGSISDKDALALQEQITKAEVAFRDLNAALDEAESQIKGCERRRNEVKKGLR